MIKAHRLLPPYAAASANTTLPCAPFPRPEPSEEDDDDCIESLSPMLPAKPSCWLLLKPAELNVLLKDDDIVVMEVQTAEAVVGERNDDIKDGDDEENMDAAKDDERMKGEEQEKDEDDENEEEEDTATEENRAARTCARERASVLRAEEAKAPRRNMATRQRME